MVCKKVENNLFHSPTSPQLECLWVAYVMCVSQLPYLLKKEVSMISWLAEVL